MLSKIIKYKFQEICSLDINNDDFDTNANFYKGYITSFELKTLQNLYFAISLDEENF